MPVDDKSYSSSIQTISSETVQLYFWDSGTRTSDAGEAAGTVVEGVLAYDNIKNESGAMQGTELDTSLSFTSTALITEVPFPYDRAEAVDEAAGTNRATVITGGFSNGDYCVDYSKGIIYGKKTSTTTTLASTSYKIKQGQTGGTSTLAADVNLIEVGGNAVTAGAGTVAAGTPRMTLASDDPAVVALQIIDDWDETNRAAVNLIASQVAITGGAGAVAANTPRMTLASDDPAVVALQIIDDWDETDRAAVNLIVGQAGIAAGTGIDGVTVPRVSLVTDVALPAGTNALGTVGLDATTDAVGFDTLFDADGDNTAQAAKANPGVLYGLNVYNSNTADAFIQLFDLAIGSITVGTTVPKQSFFVPAAGSYDIRFDVPMAFGTEINYACTTTATGNGDPIVGLAVNIMYK